MKHFLSVNDVEDIDALISKALHFKANPIIDQLPGTGKRIGLVFLNPSMRTRLSTQIAAENLGMKAIVLNVNQDGWMLEFQEGAVMEGSSVEHIKDAAPILGTYFDILGVRTFPGLKNREADYSEFYLNQFTKYAGIPVLSLESATLHPLQSLADIVTIEESFKEKRKPKIVLTWAPHVKPLPQCVANSFAQWVNAWGKADFVITHPEDFALDEQFTKGAQIETNQNTALQDADFVYVKNWSAYHDYGKVRNDCKDWMLTQSKLVHTRQAKVMHCLPVRRNVELSDDILDSKSSLVTQQAGNRVWAAQAVINEILQNR